MNADREGRAPDEPPLGVQAASACRRPPALAASPGDTR